MALIFIAGLELSKAYLPNWFAYHKSIVSNGVIAEVSPWVPIESNAAWRKDYLNQLRTNFSNAHLPYQKQD